MCDFWQTRQLPVQRTTANHCHMLQFSKPIRCLDCCPSGLQSHEIRDVAGCSLLHLGSRVPPGNTHAQR
jgi:hypothetical protein